MWTLSVYSVVKTEKYVQFQGGGTWSLPPKVKNVRRSSNVLGEVHRLGHAPNSAHRQADRDISSNSALAIWEVETPVQCHCHWSTNFGVWVTPCPWSVQPPLQAPGHGWASLRLYWGLWGSGTGLGPLRTGKEKISPYTNLLQIWCLGKTHHKEKDLFSAFIVFFFLLLSGILHSHIQIRSITCSGVPNSDS